MTLIKGILLPIRAEYLVCILNGEKTQELRDSLPKDFKEGWVYLYCTKAKPYLYWADLRDEYMVDTYKYLRGDELNGKVAARFWFDEYTHWRDLYKNEKPSYYAYKNCSLYKTSITQLLADLCLSYEEVQDYGKGKDLFAWHIKQLEIFAKPKELKDFYVLRHELVDDVFSTPPYYWCDVKHTLTKAPQSWRYVYTKEKE